MRYSATGDGVGPDYFYVHPISGEITLLKSIENLGRSGFVVRKIVVKYLFFNWFHTIPLYILFHFFLGPLLIDLLWKINHKVLIFLK